MSDDVQFSESDYNLGATSPDDGQGLAIIGMCTGSLAVAKPTRVRRIADVIELATAGPLVCVAAILIEHLGMPVTLVNSGVTTNGSYGTITKSISGTSDVTGSSGTLPKDSFDVKVIFTVGGTVGTAGIKYTYSLDGGLTTSPEQSLGTATSITLPGSTVFDLESTETVVANDYFTCRTAAPKWNDSQMTDAITALSQYQQPWEAGLILGPATATNVANIETSAASLLQMGSPKTFFTDFRRRNVSGETRTQYITAFGTEFGSTSCKFTSIGADVVKVLSSESVYGSMKWRLKRQISVALALRAMQIRPGQDPAHVRLGPLPSAFQIAANDGNPDDHDEFLFPGLDALRASSLRSRLGRPGVYIKNHRIKSSPGSDFEFVQHRRCMNVAERVATNKLELCSSQDVLVNRKTGYILEAEALAIENEVNAALREALVKTGDVTSAKWKCSRTDNLLSTKTLNGDLQIVPKAYIKTINGKASFYNPALNVVES